eukprot:scaffold1663_cov158-Skeletonema_menzelii.AAC.3
MPSLQKNIVHKCTYAQSTAVISKYGFIPANKKDTAKEQKAKVQGGGVEPPTSAVLRPRHNQLDHPCLHLPRSK